jgi:hypothetical protein
LETGWGPWKRRIFGSRCTFRWTALRTTCTPGRAIVQYLLFNLAATPGRFWPKEATEATNWSPNANSTLKTWMHPANPTMGLFYDPTLLLCNIPGLGSGCFCWDFSTPIQVRHKMIFDVTTVWWCI